MPQPQINPICFSQLLFVLIIASLFFLLCRVARFRVLIFRSTSLQFLVRVHIKRSGKKNQYRVDLKVAIRVEVVALPRHKFCHFSLPRSPTASCARNPAVSGTNLRNNLPRDPTSTRSRFHLPAAAQNRRVLPAAITSCRDTKSRSFSAAISQ